MVIGADLLSQFGKVTLDFKHHTVQFSVKGKGKEIELQGIQPHMRMNMITMEQMSKGVQKGGQEGEAFLCVISQQETKGANPCHGEIDSLLEEYGHLFEVPKALPPERNMDHKIPIKPNVPPIKQTAYRYPLMQIREIEKLVIEMLQTGVTA